MITIFNGRSRSIGSGEQEEVFVQVSVQLRQHLKQLKGAKLSVLMAIALHANREGWAWPSLDTLADETGYNKQTVSDALTDLCKTVINGCRILLVFQPHDRAGRGGKKGTFASNRYLIFPTEDEIRQFEGHAAERKPRTRTHAPNVEKIHTDDTALESQIAPSVCLPYTAEPYTVKSDVTITSIDPSSNEEGAGAKSAPPAPRKRKPRDPNQEHPACTTYYAVTGYRPNKVQAKQIAEQVTDLARWQEQIERWLSAGHKYTNVIGMLDWYHGTGRTNGVKPPVQHIVTTPDEPPRRPRTGAEIREAMKRLEAGK